MPKLKMKPIDLFECENIANSDTFSVYDCVTKTRYEISGPSAFKAARKQVTEPRTLVYAYNKRNEEVHGASRVILLTDKLLEIYDQWKAAK